VRYRWAVLAAGTAAQTGAAVFGVGLPVIAPTLQVEFGLSISQVGVLLAAPWVGATVTLLPWGLAADRFGERMALALGLGSSSLLLVGCAYAPTFHDLIGLLALAGAAGSSVQSASGRAVMQWFRADEGSRSVYGRPRSRSAGSLQH
jgi:MFS family permease